MRVFVDKDGLVAGDDWHEKIQSALAKADIFLLLVSPNSLKSRYIQEHEIAPAIEAVKSGRLRFACLHLYTIDVPEDICRFEGLNPPDEPIGEHEKDKQALAFALDAAVGKLRVLLHKLRKNPKDEHAYGERQELTVKLVRHGNTLQRSYFNATDFIDRSSYQ